MATPKKSIAARMRERCKEFTTVCVLPVEETREAVDALEALQASLKDLTDQIAATAPKAGPRFQIERRPHRGG